VHPFKMNRVKAIFLTLEPVAGNYREYDLYKTVIEGEGFPSGD